MKHTKYMHALYIDDLSEAEAIELKRRLMNDPEQRPLPLNYHYLITMKGPDIYCRLAVFCSSV